LQNSENCYNEAKAIIVVSNSEKLILVPRALLTRGQPTATRGSGQIHIKLASDWPQRNIWFIVNMNKNTQALHEAKPENKFPTAPDKVPGTN
jgi:hypothetical protein